MAQAVQSAPTPPPRLRRHTDRVTAQGTSDQRPNPADAGPAAQDHLHHAAPADPLAAATASPRGALQARALLRRRRSRGAEGGDAAAAGRCPGADRLGPRRRLRLSLLPAVLLLGPARLDALGFGAVGQRLRSRPEWHRHHVRADARLHRRHSPRVLLRRPGGRRVGAKAAAERELLVGGQRR